MNFPSQIGLKDYKIILCIDISVWKVLSDYDQYSFPRHAFNSLFQDEYESQKFYTFMLLIVKHSSISFSLTRLISTIISKLIFIGNEFQISTKKKSLLKLLTRYLFLASKKLYQITIKVSSKHYSIMIFIGGSKVQTIHYDQSIVHSSAE